MFFLPILLPVFIYLLLLSTDDINIGVFIINKLKDYGIVFPYTWFVLTLTVLYTSYYLLSSLLKGALLYISELLFLLIFSYIMIIFQIDGTTFITTYCFLAGAIYKYLEKHICRFQTRIYVVAFIYMLFMTTTILSLSAPPFKGYAAFGALVWTVCFIFLYTRTKVQYNVVFDHFKSISYDVFLCQGIAFHILKEKLYFEDNLLYAFFL